jgi:putative glycosyltransferase (TIGR04372 family)
MKIKTISTRLIKIIIMVMLSTPFLLLVSAMRHFYLIRWSGLYSLRLGHFAANTELYCCERDNDINVPKIAHIDLFYLDSIVCNKQLAEMWRRKLSVVPRFVGVVLIGATVIISVFKKNIPSLKMHLINTASRDRDVHNLIEKTTKHLTFTPAEEVEGQEWLKDNNIPANAKIVLLMVRDSEYMDKHISGHDWSASNFRDCDINNFVAAAEELANMGFYVFRMGYHVNYQLQSSHPLVIDYATNGMRNDFMDIYLASICTFVITTHFGAEAPAAYCFRKPRVIVDACPTGVLSTWNSYDLLLTKHHFSQQNNRELSLSEIFSNDVGFCLETQCYIDKGIKLMENTPEEILEITMEMVQRLDGNWKAKDNDSNLQNKSWKIFPVDTLTTRNDPMQGEIKARFGADFLRNNPDWLR